MRELEEETEGGEKVRQVSVREGVNPTPCHLELDNMQSALTQVR